MPNGKTECIFCKVAGKKLPGTFYHESENVVAVKNINPVTPVHILIMPVKHITEMYAVEDADLPIISEMVQVIKKLIKEFNLEQKGYRITVNGGGANEIEHLHWHLMGPVSINRGL